MATAAYCALPLGGGDRPRHALDRLLAPLDPLPEIVEVVGDGAPVWLHADDGWALRARPSRLSTPPESEIARFLLEDGTAVGVTVVDGRVRVPFSLAEAYAGYVTEGWRELLPQRGLSSGKLDLYYRVKRFIPRSAQLALRRALIRRQGLPSFPAWPLDTSVGRLLEFYVRCLLAADGSTALPFRWFWPHESCAALVLTHDVESAAGLRLAPELADLEEAHGFRSSFNIVADWYPIDRGILRELDSRGFEIGLHGLHHDRSLFESRASFEAQQPALRAAARELGAAGFRSPATHRVVDWLPDLPVEYDCTIPNSDPYEPQPGGCCSVWPFFLGDVVELPWTLTQDHIVFTLLRHRSIDLWLEQTAAIEHAHGLVQVVSHPDPGYLGDREKHALYAELLDALAERTALWHALPRDVARWWRARDLGLPGTEGVGWARLAEDRVVFEPPAEAPVVERGIRAYAG